MAKTVSVLNQKGGVGKTTTAVNLSACIGDLGKRVLLVDIDPQGNTTSGFGIDKRKTEVSSYDVLTGGADAESVIIHTEFKNIDIILSLSHPTKPTDSLFTRRLSVGFLYIRTIFYLLAVCTLHLSFVKACLLFSQIVNRLS